MHNFKAGDEAILVSVEPHWKVQVGTKVRVHKPTVGGAGPGYYVELSTQPGSTRYYAEHRLGPVDDPLPPAPESVMYFNSIRDKGNDQCITVGPVNDPYYAGTLCISVHPRGDYEGYQSVALDPDAALQLAHDLNRMAMEIKRKEKQG